MVKSQLDVICNYCLPHVICDTKTFQDLLPSIRYSGVFHILQVKDVEYSSRFSQMYSVVGIEDRRITSINTGEKEPSK
jgi:hypothetical protein